MGRLVGIATHEVVHLFVSTGEERLARRWGGRGKGERETGLKRTTLLKAQREGGEREYILGSNYLSVKSFSQRLPIPLVHYYTTTFQSFQIKQSQILGYDILYT